MLLSGSGYVVVVRTGEVIEGPEGEAGVEEEGVRYSRGVNKGERKLRGQEKSNILTWQKNCILGKESE